MSLPPPVRARLKPLLLLLSSSHDGERAAATAAIGRLLERNNADWHDLAGALVEDPPPPPALPPAPPLDPQLRPPPDGRFSIKACDLTPLTAVIRESGACSYRAP